MRPKYNNKSTNGFPSKLEAAVFAILNARKYAGEITDIKRQQCIVLQEGPQKERITWRVDFSFTNLQTGELNLAEAKGFATEVYKLKLKLYRKNPKYTCEIWVGSYKKPYLQEIIKAK